MPLWSTAISKPSSHSWYFSAALPWWAEGKSIDILKKHFWWAGRALRSENVVFSSSLIRHLKTFTWSSERSLKSSLNMQIRSSPTFLSLRCSWNGLRMGSRLISPMLGAVWTSSLSMYVFYVHHFKEKT